MSTNAAIAVRTNDGYKTIYCHNDGYFNYMYPMLSTYYASQERADALVELGDTSFIAKRLLPSKDSDHSFDNPEEDVCIFYHRDRGEPLHCTAASLLGKEEVLRMQYYAYIFEDGQWRAYQGGVEVDNYDY